jgi:hypothetical protein
MIMRGMIGFRRGQASPSSRQRYRFRLWIRSSLVVHRTGKGAQRGFSLKRTLFLTQTKASRTRFGGIGPNEPQFFTTT